jgi:hypothetical protein
MQKYPYHLLLISEISTINDGEWLIYKCYTQFEEKTVLILYSPRAIHLLEIKH